MSNKPGSERRGTDRRSDRRRIGLYDDTADRADTRRNPLNDKVREAWRQILDRRRGERRLSDRHQHMPAEGHVANGVEAGG